MADDCKVFSGTDCTECRPGFFLDTVPDKDQCRRCSDYIWNCRKCSDANTCEKCFFPSSVSSNDDCLAGYELQEGPPDVTQLRTALEDYEDGTKTRSDFLMKVGVRDNCKLEMTISSVS